MNTIRYDELATNYYATSMVILLRTDCVRKTICWLRSVGSLLRGLTPVGQQDLCLVHILSKMVRMAVNAQSGTVGLIQTQENVGKLFLRSQTYSFQSQPLGSNICL